MWPYGVLLFELRLLGASSSAQTHQHPHRRSSTPSLAPQLLCNQLPAKQRISTAAGGSLKAWALPITQRQASSGSGRSKWPPSRPARPSADTGMTSTQLGFSFLPRQDSLSVPLSPCPNSNSNFIALSAVLVFMPVGASTQVQNRECGSLVVFLFVGLLVGEKDVDSRLAS